MEIILELLRADGSIIINKNMAKNIGVECTIIFSELISRYIYFKNKNQLDEDGYFFNTVDDLEEATTFSEYQQRKYINKLVKLGLIKYKVKGLPPKRFFKIIQNKENLEQYLKNSGIKTLKIQELKPEKLRTNNTNYNNTNGINISKDIYGKSSDLPNLNFSNIDLDETNSPKKDKNIIESKNIKNNLIEYWNEFSLCRKHKNSNTLVYKKINNFITQLKNGTFTRKHSLNQDFIKNHKISNELLNKKWKDEEIKEILNRLFLLHQEGYWPHDKKIIKKGLDILIYNDRTGYSFFFKVAICSPKPFNDQLPEIKHPSFEKYKEFFKDHLHGVKEEKTLIYMFNDLYDEINSIYDKISVYLGTGGFSSYFGRKNYMEPFFDQHLAWLKKIKNSHPGYMKLNSYSWKNFVLWVKDYHGYNLYPTKEELKDMKFFYEDILRSREQKKEDIISMEDYEYII